MRFKQTKPKPKQTTKKEVDFQGWFIPVIQLLKDVFEFPFETN